MAAFKNPMNSPQKKIQTRFLTDADYPRWDAFVEESPQGCIFHTSKWAAIIKSVFKRKFEILVIEKKDIIQAGILFWPKNQSIFRSITYIPNTSYQGPLFIQSESTKLSTINAQYEKYSSELIDFLLKNYNLIDIPLSPTLTDCRPFQWHNFKVSSKYTYRFPIIDMAEMEKQFSQDLRRKLKDSATEQNDFRESKDTNNLVSFIYQSYKQHGMTPAINNSQLQEFLDLCLSSDAGKLYYQYYDDAAVAGIFVLTDSRNVYALFSGIDSNYRHKINSELLHIHVLSQEIFKGKIFDFLGANTKDLEQFKRSFGGELTPYFTVTYTKNKVINLLLSVRSKSHILKRRIKSNL
ncbi:MAG: GNAT family N-acetyltransferase [Calditrichae bacterium]|nr:GNAT family N-acetyltransferase [Calditrichia bacterium]